MAHVVTAALVSVKDSSGAQSYFYQGATIPDGFDKDDLKRLSAAKLIGPAPKPDSETGDK